MTITAQEAHAISSPIRKAKEIEDRLILQPRVDPFLESCYAKIRARSLEGHDDALVLFNVNNNYIPEGVILLAKDRLEENGFRANLGLCESVTCLTIKWGHLQASAPSIPDSNNTPKKA